MKSFQRDSLACTHAQDHHLLFERFFLHNNCAPAPTTIGSTVTRKRKIGEYNHPQYVTLVDISNSHPVPCSAHCCIHPAGSRIYCRPTLTSAAFFYIRGTALANNITYIECAHAFTSPWVFYTAMRTRSYTYVRNMPLCQKPPQICPGQLTTTCSLRYLSSQCLANGRCYAYYMHRVLQNWKPRSVRILLRLSSIQRVTQRRLALLCHQRQYSHPLRIRFGYGYEPGSWSHTYLQPARHRVGPYSHELHFGAA